MSERLTGAQALVRSLELVGVDVVFGLPGGAILPAYDPLIESSIRHILVRHEQGAGHMAQGYYWTSGKPGVAVVTSGPGATNIITPVTDAYMDSVPMVVIAGQVARAAIGSDAFQEAPTFNMLMSVTKHNYVVMDPVEIPQVIAEAFHIATTGRPGPVYIDVPKDVLSEDMDWWWPENADDNLPGYRPTRKGHPRQIKEAIRLLNDSERPVIYAGGGILKARGADALRAFAEATGVHVVTTLMARGAFPDDHELCLGMPGMHGNFTAVTSMQKADLLLALGSRFDDRVTGKVSAFAPHAKVVHVDVDPAELSKVRTADVPIVGDCRLVIEALTAEYEKSQRRREERGDPPTDRTAWDTQLREWRDTYPYRYVSGGDDELKPQYVIERLFEAAPESVLVAGVGQHQMFASQWWRFNEPYTWINSGGLGTMGFAVPAAVGAKVGRPDATVWAIDGDGCFQMTSQELITASVEGIPVKIAILNNGYLGMVKQWQELFYDERYSEVHLGFDVPDYVKLAEAMGCAGFRVEHPGEVDAVIAKAMDIDDRPVVIDFRIDPREKVYPMVPAGTSNDGIILGPAFGQVEDERELLAMSGSDGAAPMTHGGEDEPPPEHPDGKITMDKGGF
jgi:acetolactate synthase-1/2/3 large subunit